MWYNIICFLKHILDVISVSRHIFAAHQIISISRQDCIATQQLGPLPYTLQVVPIIETEYILPYRSN